MARNAEVTAPTTVAARPNGLTPPESPRCMGSRVRMFTGGRRLYTPTSDAHVSAVLAARAPDARSSSHGSPVAVYASAHARNGTLFASTCRNVRGPLCLREAVAPPFRLTAERAISFDATFELPKNHMSSSHSGHPPIANASVPTATAPRPPATVSNRSRNDASATAPDSSNPASAGV